MTYEIAPSTERDAIAVGEPSLPHTVPRFGGSAGVATTLDEVLHVRIRRSKGWVSLRLRDLWEYRELLYFLTWRDIKVRYKQTALGAAWAILQTDHRGVQPVLRSAGTGPVGRPGLADLQLRGLPPRTFSAHALAHSSHQSCWQYEPDQQGSTRRARVGDHLRHGSGHDGLLPALAKSG
jgi:hypothetical protein